MSINQIEWSDENLDKKNEQYKNDSNLLKDAPENVWEAMNEEALSQASSLSSLINDENSSDDDVFDALDKQEEDIYEKSNELVEDSMTDDELFWKKEIEEEMFYKKSDMLKSSESKSDSMTPREIAEQIQKDKWLKYSTLSPEIMKERVDEITSTPEFTKQFEEKYNKKIEEIKNDPELLKQVDKMSEYFSETITKIENEKWRYLKEWEIKNIVNEYVDNNSYVNTWVDSIDDINEKTKEILSEKLLNTNNISSKMKEASSQIMDLNFKELWFKDTMKTMAWFDKYWELVREESLNSDVKNLKSFDWLSKKEINEYLDKLNAGIDNVKKTLKSDTNLEENELLTQGIDEEDKEEFLKSLNTFSKNTINKYVDQLTVRRDILKKYWEDWVVTQEELDKARWEFKNNIW